MKLLHVSDLHFRKPWFDWVATHAKDYDAVCLTGDLLNLFDVERVSLPRQARYVEDWLAVFEGRLFVSSGNHDYWDADGGIDLDVQGGWLDKMSCAHITVNGQGAVCAGHFIYCQGFLAPPVWPVALTDRWILLHHLPPALTATAMNGLGGVHGGSTELASALTLSARPPWLVLSGHIHKPKSWRGRCGSSWSFNPTCDEMASFPNHIVIDSDSATATWLTERAGTWPLKVL